MLVEHQARRDDANRDRLDPEIDWPALVENMASIVRVADDRVWLDEAGARDESRRGTPVGLGRQATWYNLLRKGLPLRYVAEAVDRTLEEEEPRFALHEQLDGSRSMMAGLVLPLLKHGAGVASNSSVDKAQAQNTTHEFLLVAWGPVLGYRWP